MPACLLGLLLAASPLAPLPLVPPAVSPEMRPLRADPAAVQSLRITLALPDRAGLDALIAAQRNPASPEFRRWLTPEQFGARFGRTAAEYQRLIAVLVQGGLRVTPFRNRLYLEAQGTVAQVERLLGVQLVDAVARGHHLRSYRGTPQLPAEVVPMILSVEGLDTRRRYSHRLAANGAKTLGPQDLRRFYDIEALHAQGYAGQLSEVALVGSIQAPVAAVSLADVQYFYSAVSDSTAVPVIDSLPLGSSDPETEIDAAIEEEMDMEMPTIAAPLLSKVTLVQAPLDSLFISGFNEINENLPQVTAVSTSFGLCEQDVADGGFFGDTEAVVNAVAQGAAEGIAFFAAAGDYGANDCGTSILSVDFPASVPYLIGVGGTMYTGPFDAQGGVTAHGFETTWNEDAGFGYGFGGGGGDSTLYPQPWYQHAPGTRDGGPREVPDISLVASITPGVAIVDTLPGQIDNDGDGTSDAAPMAAGMFALVNDYIGGCRLGSPAPDLYALGQSQYTGGTAVFYDITTGNNSNTGVVGYAAGPGYDRATGLGSLDVAALAQAWVPCRVEPASGVDAGPAPDSGSHLLADGGVELVWPGGFAVDAGLRTPYAPCTSLACSAPSSCFTFPEGPSQCTEVCATAHPDCTTGNVCESTDAGTACTAGCPLGLSDCPVACDPADPLTCGLGYYCSPADGGVCVPGCATNQDCPGGNVCVYGYCLPACDLTDAGSCQLQSYCLGFDAGAACIPGCATRANCGAGEICLGGGCAPSCDPSSPTSCGADYYCSALDAGVGTCTYGCQVSANCPAGQVCSFGYCALECDPSATDGGPCSPDSYCFSADGGVGSCLYGCLTSANCGPGSECLSGYCYQTCTATDAGSCPIESYCYSVDGGAGLCESGCLVDANCAPGQICFNYACLPTCSPSDPDPCPVQSYCAPIEPDGGSACVSGCLTTANCYPGEVCFENGCYAACDPAGAESTCPPVESCSALDAGIGVDAGVGVCVFGCNSSTSCGAGATCEACSGYCVPDIGQPGAIGAPCVTSAECFSGTYCTLADAGYPGGWCTLGCGSGCCGEGATCLTEGAYCAPACSVRDGGAGCRPGYTCDSQDGSNNGVCLPACSTSADCFVVGDPGTCDAATGVCIPSASSSTSSSSGSLGSAGSNGSSTGTSASAGASSSGASASSSLGSTQSSAAASSASGSSHSASSSPGTSTTGSTHASGSTSSGLSTGSSGGSSSGTPSHSTGSSSGTGHASSTGGSSGGSSSAKGSGGCGCNSGAALDGGWLWLLVAGLGRWARRRTRAS